MSAVVIFLILGALGLLWLFGERWKPVLPSTRALVREGGLGPLVSGKALHGYVYGRWTNQYVRILIHRVFPRLGPRGKTWLSDRYHGKVLTHEQAAAIVKIEKDIPRQDLEQIIPYPVARQFVLEAPTELAAYECGCRHARESPCHPTQVCLVAGQPFVDFVLEHNPRSSRRLTQAEALDILREEHERGHVHSAWFKDALLDRFYTICNCCKCCCGGIEAMTRYGIPAVASSGYVAHVDETRCSGCGTCEETCAFAAVSVNGTAALKWDLCMGCGTCEDRCPSGAIALVRDERKGIPLDVRLLQSQPSARGSL